MKFLKQYKTAIILTVIVCVLATLLGMRLSVGRQRAGVEEMFRNNNDDSGKGLGQYLKQIDENAYNLIQLGKQNGISTEDLSEARDRYAKAKTYSDYYDAYLDLCSAADRLNAALDEKELSVQSEYMRDKYYQNGIVDQKAKLSHMAIDFNECVDSYNKIFKSFPMNLFRYLIGVGEAEKFA